MLEIEVLFLPACYCTALCVDELLGERQRGAVTPHSARWLLAALSSLVRWELMQ